MHADPVSTKMVDAASDDRTVNNGMRHKYRVLSEEEKAQMVAIKDAGLALEQQITALMPNDPYPDKQGNFHSFAIARDRLREAVMWAVRGIVE